MSGTTEDDIAALIRAAGRRETPSPEALARMRGAVHAQWQAGLHERRRQRWLAVAATLLAATALPLLYVGVRDAASATPVAGVTAGGDALVIERGWRRLLDPVVPGEIEAGDVAVARAGAVLARADGLTLRLDAGTRVEWADSERVRLLAGRLYVDTGRGAEAASVLRIESGTTLVEHVGTRFVTGRDAGGGTFVAVRDGRVRVTPGRGAAAEIGRGGTARVGAGTQAVEVGSVAAAGPQWAWVDALAPSLAIDGRDLLSVLRDLAHEAGVELSFGDGALQAHAQATLLHGPQLDLPPLAAVEAVLATTTFAADPAALAGGQLRITSR